MASGSAADLDRWLAPFLAMMRRVTRRTWAPLYLRGLLGPGDRKSLQLMAPFARVGANATGNGRWFEGYLCGLLPPTITVGGLHINPEGCTPPIAAPNQGVGRR